jgi:hypothetical protein
MKNNSLRSWGYFVLIISVVVIVFSALLRLSTTGGMIIFLASVILFTGSAIEKAVNDQTHELTKPKLSEIMNHK